MTQVYKGLSFVPSILLAGSVFAILTVPLAAFGARPVEVELQNRTVFSGSLEEVATSYLGTTAALSLAVGLAGHGWRQRARTKASGKAVADSTDEMLQLRAKELEEKLTLDQLQASGLDFFLDNSQSPDGLDAVIQSQLSPLPHHRASFPQSNPSPGIAAASNQVVSVQVHATGPQAAGRVIPMAPSVTPPTVRGTAKARMAMPHLPAAQTYMSFARSPLGETLHSVQANRDLQAELEALKQLEQMREQIRSLSIKMEQLQVNLNRGGPEAPTYRPSGPQRLVPLRSVPQPVPTYTVRSMEVVSLEGGLAADSVRSGRHPAAS